MKKWTTAFIVFLLALTLIPWAGKAETPGGFLSKEGKPPLGANQPSCKPTKEHPEPVILVPGTFERMDLNWNGLSPVLKSKGYCVYSLNYGYSKAGYSTGPIEDSAKELKAFIDNVLKLTGADKVSIVGHSQGGMMPRYYIKFLGGDKKVDDLVGIVPSNHGTKGFAGLPDPTWTTADLLSCAACKQQKTGSEFLNKLNKGNETPGKVSYTVIATRNDEVVVPYTSAFLKGSKQQVSNIALQDYYPSDKFEHQFIPYDPHVDKFVLDALANKGPADPERAVGVFH
ncbi:triacylglycerol esterase/lipase EstA (alpha/beta hydrolase family) [Scopulibacillus daqui]|uniref:Triacylglycerol esterase/lipase EstA (Alpha/beta hydrolase family) n=1 Tax=Scopulibacillus daqui TaxID=1469162 RepID=A0ABS2PWF6_9BACL|nr:alpha/beta fold hydrolase [Scopulibacillus daqui]MBM7643890.1 triacylglycerol esterase/lipase EstA (alpha/beta hydrolase family) [Scopulibacillus daqui]